MKCLSLAVLFLVLTIGVASAISIPVNTITIMPSSSNAYPNVPVGSGSVTNPAEYVHLNALDRDTTGAHQRYYSDFAAGGTGVNTVLDFQFSTPISFDQIVFTDRQSSGGGNFSNARGIFDYVTSYQYIFSNNANFSSPVATVVVSGRTVPTALDTNLAAWQTTSVFGTPITARYVRWDVISANGVNPGMADIDFFGSPVPEPGTYALMATVGAALLLFKRRRASAAK